MGITINITSLDVSIHAPARGATALRDGFGRSVLVSIHAPARGATAMDGIVGSRDGRFNPRAREGRDRNGNMGILCRI